MIAPGTKVRLLPYEDQPEQYGTVLGNDALYEPSGAVYVVALDRAFVDDAEVEDDAIREVPADQLEVCT